MAGEGWKTLSRDFVVENVFVGEVRVNGGGAFRQVKRKENQLFLCLGNTLDYVDLNGNNFLTIHAGDILIMPTGSSYEARSNNTEGTVGYGILFNLMDKKRNEIILGTKPEIIFKDKNDYFTEKFAEMRQLMLKGGFSMMQIKARLYELLYLFANRQIQEQADGQIKSILPAIQYMENHLQDNCSIEMLARMCFMSRSTFHRRFFAEFHTSPIAWHLRARIQKSRELLASGMYSVEMVAETMGFCDTCYFSRMFYKYTGRHARDYRKKG